MDPRRRNLKIIVLMLLAGAVIGSVLDFRVFSITFGLTLRVNFMGLLGMGVAYYLLRYYRV